MDESECLKTRVDGQIGWYDKKICYHQKWYKGLRIVEIVAAASIPFLVGHITDTEFLFRTVVGRPGLGIAVITAVVSLCQFQENWAEYRTTWESVKHERHLFLTKAEPYNVGTRSPLLVQRVEWMISKENKTWSQYMRPQKRETKHG